MFDRFLRSEDGPVVPGRGRFYLTFFVGLILLVVMVVVARPWWQPRYHQWRNADYNAKARLFLEEGKPDEAMLMLQNAHRHVSTNAVTWELYADCDRVSGGESYPLHLAMALGFAPGDERLGAKCLRACAETRRFDLADLVAAHLTNAASGSAEIHHQLANLATLNQNRSRAGDEFRRALELAANDPRIRLSRASFEATSPEAADRERGLATLRELQGDSVVGGAARETLANVLSISSPADALVAWDQVLGADDANWSARRSRFLLKLQVQPESAWTDFQDVVTAARSDVQKAEAIRIALDRFQLGAARTVFTQVTGGGELPVVLRQMQVELAAAGTDWDEVQRVCHLMLQRPELLPDQRLVFHLWQLVAARRRGDEVTAEATAQAMERLCEDESTQAYRAADWLERKGDSRDALRFYEIARSTGLMMLRQLSLRRLVALYDTQPPHARLEPTLLEHLKMDRGDYAGTVRLAELRLETAGREREAEVLARQCHQFNPADPRARLALLRAWLVLGSAEERRTLVDGFTPEQLGAPRIRLAVAQSECLANDPGRAAALVEGLDTAGFTPTETLALERVRKSIEFLRGRQAPAAGAP